METNIKERWQQLCNEYVLLFCNKHGYVYDTDMWIAGKVGTIIEIGDMLVNLDDIRYDIDNNVPEHKFEQWYWKDVKVYELTGKKYMNYPSYCQGAPDYYTPEKLEEIRKAKKEVQAAQEALLECINSINN